MQVRVRTSRNGVKIFKNADNPTIGVKQHLCVAHIENGMQVIEIINQDNWVSFTLVKED